MKAKLAPPVPVSLPIPSPAPAVAVLPAKGPRFWQNSVLFSDGRPGVLTIQSEQGRSDNNERIFVLQAFGGVRASLGWTFSFQGGPREVPAFAPETVAEMLSESMPYWIVPAAKQAA